VNFPVFAKIDVNGANAIPLYKHLTKEARGLLGSEPVKWNFTKFLVNRDGKAIKRFAPTATPDSLHADVEALL